MIYGIFGGVLARDIFVSPSRVANFSATCRSKVKQHAKQYCNTPWNKIASFQSRSSASDYQLSNPILFYNSDEGGHV